MVKLLRYLTVFLIAILSVGCNGNNEVSCNGIYSKELRAKVYSHVDKMPIYKNGTGDFLADFAGNLVPVDTILTVLNLEFVVLSNGKISNFQIYDKDKTSLITDKITVKFTMETDVWTPGECNGKKVAVKMEFPVKLDWQE